MSIITAVFSFSFIDFYHNDFLCLNWS
jgi:hypothetical protein